MTGPYCSTEHVWLINVKIFLLQRTDTMEASEGVKISGDNDSDNNDNSDDSDTTTATTTMAMTAIVFTRKVIIKHCNYFLRIFTIAMVLYDYHYHKP
jgi:hypothetical protein